jgi:hypothetical protein
MYHLSTEIVTSLTDISVTYVTMTLNGTVTQYSYRVSLFHEPSSGQRVNSGSMDISLKHFVCNQSSDGTIATFPSVHYYLIGEYSFMNEAVGRLCNMRVIIFLEGPA